jgi:hypothetical protein
MNEILSIRMEPPKIHARSAPAQAAHGETEFLAVVAGGIGPNTWDREVTIKGVGMTMSQAAHAIEQEIAGAGGGAITWIEQLN